MPNVKSYCKNVKILDLERTTSRIRENVIKMLFKAGSGHSAGSLGTADIFTALYFEILQPADKFILSNGHICPVWYATLAEKGLIEMSELATLRQFGSKLQGHPHANIIDGIENSSGPLGQGLSFAIGVAQAYKMDEKDGRIYCMTSDGELNEGQIWEAAMCAPSKNLTNLTWIIDRNEIQIDGTTENIMPLEPLREKLESFNWFVIEIDGNNIEEVINACKLSRSVTQRPTAIIAHTIPGMGVKFMEYKFDWHGKAPNKVETTTALKQLRSLESRIESDYE